MYKREVYMVAYVGWAVQRGRIAVSPRPRKQSWNQARSRKARHSEMETSSGDVTDEADQQSHHTNTHTDWYKNTSTASIRGNMSNSVAGIQPWNKWYNRKEAHDGRFPPSHV